MKVYVSLVRYSKNPASYLAQLTDGWEELGTIDLVEGDTPEAACLAAAKLLRIMACRFERLATEPESLKLSVQHRINEAPPDEEPDL